MDKENVLGQAAAKQAARRRREKTRLKGELAQRGGVRKKAEGKDALRRRWVQAQAEAAFQLERRKQLAMDVLRWLHPRNLDIFAHEPRLRVTVLKTLVGAGITFLLLFLILAALIIDYARVQEEDPFQSFLVSASDYPDSGFTVALPSVGFRVVSDINDVNTFLSRTEASRYFRFSVDQVSLRPGNTSELEVLPVQACTGLSSDFYRRLFNAQTDCITVEGTDGAILRATAEYPFTEYVHVKLIPCDDAYQASLTPPGPTCKDADEIEEFLYGSMTVVNRTAQPQPGVFMFIRTQEPDGEIVRTYRWRASRPTVAAALVDFVFMRFSDKIRWSLSNPVEDQLVFDSLWDITRDRRTGEDVVGEFVLRLGRTKRKHTNFVEPLFNILADMGGIIFFLLITIGYTARYYNERKWNQDIGELDVRQLDATNFDDAGHLIEGPEWYPAELRAMKATSRQEEEEMSLLRKYEEEERALRELQAAAVPREQDEEI